MALTHMVLPKRKSEKSAEPATVGRADDGGDRYSYEHRLSLDDEALKKLKAPNTLKGGSPIQLHARGYVHRHEINDTHDGGPKRHMAIQLTHMELGEGKKERKAKASAARLNEIGSGKRTERFT